MTLAICKRCIYEIEAKVDRAFQSIEAAIAATQPLYSANTPVRRSRFQILPARFVRAFCISCSKVYHGKILFSIYHLSFVI